MDGSQTRPRPAGDQTRRTPGEAVIVAETHAQTAARALGQKDIGAAGIGPAPRGADQHQAATAQFDEVRVAETPEPAFPRPVDLVGAIPGRAAVAAVAQGDPAAAVAQRPRRGDKPAGFRRWKVAAHGGRRPPASFGAETIRVARLIPGYPRSRRGVRGRPDPGRRGPAPGRSSARGKREGGSENRS